MLGLGCHHWNRTFLHLSGLKSHQESFDRLKLALTSAPVLAYPNYDKPFLLETDASLKGLGAVLSQEDNDGNMHVISYASHTLQPYEKSMWNYSSAKLELLALKWSVCEKFRDYLIDSKFTVLTDNNSLTYVRTSQLGASQIRWLSDLALFDFDIKYRVGKSNQAADALSRATWKSRFSFKIFGWWGGVGSHFLWDGLPNPWLPSWFSQNTL